MGASDKYVYVYMWCDSRESLKRRSLHCKLLAGRGSMAAYCWSHSGSAALFAGNLEIMCICICLQGWMCVVCAYLLSYKVYTILIYVSLRWSKRLLAWWGPGEEKDTDRDTLYMYIYIYIYSGIIDEDGASLQKRSRLPFDRTIEFCWCWAKHSTRYAGGGVLIQHTGDCVHLCIRCCRRRTMASGFVFFIVVGLLLPFRVCANNANSTHGQGWWRSGGGWV